MFYQFNTIPLKPIHNCSVLDIECIRWLSRSTGERQEHKKEIRDARTNPTQPMVALTQSSPPPAKPQRQDQCW